MAEKKGRSEPERRAREPRKQGGGIVRTFAGIIVLGVIAGLGVAFKDQIKAMIAPPEKAPVAAAPQKPAPPPEPAKAPEPVVPLAKPAAPIEKKAAVVTPPPMAKVGADDAAAKKIIAAGRTALEQFDFNGAMKLFKEAGTKQTGTAEIGRAHV